MPLRGPARQGQVAHRGLHQHTRVPAGHRLEKPKPSRTLLLLGIGGQPAARTAFGSPFAMNLPSGGAMRVREKLIDIHPQDVGNVPEPLIGNATFSPFDAYDHHPSEPCLKPQRLLGKLLLNSEFTDLGSDLLAAFLPPL